jgi:hypothetical protein
MDQQPPEKLVNRAPEGTVSFGGTVDRSRLALRIFGDAVDPSEITTLLGHEPTEAMIKGETWIGKKSGKEHIAKTGSWRLKAPEFEPADLDAQIEWIFPRLTGDLETWNKLTVKYKVDLFSGLFLDADNRGITLLPPSMKNYWRSRHKPRSGHLF